MKILSFIFFSLVGTWAYAEFKIPELTGPVVDKAGLLTAQQERRLNERLYHIRQMQGPQIGILLVPSLEGLSIEEASIKVAEKWKLGSQKGDDGILILLAQAEHAVRIEVGQGLEGAIPDAVAKRIVEDVMIPFFRSGHFAEGLFQGIIQITRRAAPQVVIGEPQNLEFKVKRVNDLSATDIVFHLFILFVVLLFIILFIGPFGRGNRVRWDGGSGWSRDSRGGWGGGFSGGGWSGGGGGFSGGGASGRW